MIPTMKEMIHEDMIKVHFFIYTASLFFFLIGAVLTPLFIVIGALLFVVSNLFFLINCITGSRKYAKIAQTNPMDAFSQIGA
jgi:uncharacterized membrane protein